MSRWLRRKNSFALGEDQSAVPLHVPGCRHVDVGETVHDGCSSPKVLDGGFVLLDACAVVEISGATNKSCSVSFFLCFRGPCERSSSASQSGLANERSS